MWIAASLGCWVMVIFIGYYNTYDPRRSTEDEFRMAGSWVLWPLFLIRIVVKILVAGFKELFTW